jgi:hypothetical protein
MTLVLEIGQSELFVIGYYILVDQLTSYIVVPNNSIGKVNF